MDEEVIRDVTTLGVQHLRHPETGQDVLGLTMTFEDGRRHGAVITPDQLATYVCEIIRMATEVGPDYVRALMNSFYSGRLSPDESKPIPV